MSAITTDILIKAPPERVWAVLMDFAAYPAWNPFIISIEGAPLAALKARAEAG
jgi:uncharacterized protein YndB with AHSA1/START domain